MKKKVCMVVPSFTAKGGITSVVNGYRNSQLTEDYDVRFIETYCDGSVIQKTSKALSAYLKFIYTALFWKPNLVHVHSSFGGSFYRKALIIEIASLSKIPVVNHVHGADFDEFYRKKSQKKKKTIEKIYNKCIRTIALSEEWKKNLAEIVPEQTIRVVENYGILQEDLIKEKFTKPNNKLILFLGFICERKGCFDIPAIVDQVCRKIPDARFILGGSGEIEKVKQKLRAKYKENVEFPGWIRNEQKKQYLRDADIFLLPSYNEGMPMAILDAMGCGLPIVSTDVGGIPKIVRQGINGYLYKPGDSKSMACAIIEYLTDDEKRLKAGRESVDVIRKSYSLQQNIDKLERVYTEVERLRSDKLLQKKSIKNGGLKSIKKIGSLVYRSEEFVRKVFYKIFRESAIKSSFGNCGKNVHIAEKSDIKGIGNISIGDDVAIGPHALLWTTRANIIIKEKVIIGPGLSIITGDHKINVVGKYMADVTDEEKDDENDQDVIIEKDVWIGANVTILKGVTVAEGSVVGAGTVLTKNTHPYGVYVGVPGKCISERFENKKLEDHINILKEKSKW